MKIIIQILLLVTLFNIKATSNDLKVDTLFVGITTELLIREKPTIDSKIIAKKSFGDKVPVIYSDFHPLDTSEFDEDWSKIHKTFSIGWVKTPVQNAFGYVFTGYLTNLQIDKSDDNDSPIQILTEGSFCLSKLIFDPDFYWYGLYLYDSDYGKYFRLDQIDIEITTAFEDDVGGDLKIITNKNEKSKFLIGFKKQIDITKNISCKAGNYFENPIEIFPGQKIKCTRYSDLFAFGCTDSINNNGSPVIKNHDVFITHNQNIQKIMSSINVYEDCYYNDLVWYGDLNHDGSPEVITRKANTSQMMIKLFMGSLYFGDKSTVVREVSKFETWNCN